MRKFKASGLIAILVICVLCLSACQESTEAKYERAQKLLIEAKYFEASSLFDEISTYADSSRMSMYTKAIALGENGDIDAAISNFKALGDFKDSPMMITYYTGRQYENQAKADNWSPWITAAEYYDMVGFFLDSKTRAENCRKRVYDAAVRMAGNGEYGQSIQMLETLGTFSDSENLKQYYAAAKLEQEEKYAEASAAFTALGDYKDAAAQARLALKRGYEKGETLEKAGKQEEACAVFASLGDYEDASERACKPYYDLGIAKREEKDWYAAIRAFELAGDYSDAATQILETRYQQAEYKRDQQNWEEAIRLFRELDEYKDSALQANETYYRQADALEQKGDQEGAYDLFVSLGRYKDSYERAHKPYYDLGIAKREAQEWDEAVAAFSKAGKYSDAATQISETYYRQAEALEAAGDQEGAYQLFISLGEYSDSFERANKPYYELGVAKREAGEWDEARTAFAHAGTYSDADEQISTTYYAEGEAKREAGEWDEARTAFTHAGTYSDAEQQISATYYAEGEAKRSEQNWDGAREAFTNAGTYKDAAEQITETTYREAAALSADNPESAIALYATIGEYADSAVKQKELWYQVGLKRQEAQAWDEAADAFTQAGDFSDAQTQIAATRFLEGEARKTAQDWDGAISAYEAAEGYGESAYRIQECLYQKAVSLCEQFKAGEVSALEVTAALAAISDTELYRQARTALKEGKVFQELWLSEITTGDRILMGRYEQDNNPENGPEEISWTVLYAGEGKLLLLSEKVIDGLPFLQGKHRTDLSAFNAEEIWQQSDVRSWLNSEFASCFTEEEAAQIAAGETGDRIFLLDNKEYKKYCSGEDSTTVSATEYALSKDSEHHDLLHYRKGGDGSRIPGSSVMWWIRTGAVKEESYLYPEDLGTIAGVRPAVWIYCGQGPDDEWIDAHYPIP